MRAAVRLSTLYFRCGTFEFKIGGYMLGSKEHALNIARHERGRAQRRFTGASQWVASGLYASEHRDPNLSRADLLEAA